ncbi:MAG: benzoyl-CoA 2,3-epoxidase subunit BoxB [Alphaproteobacteria bacterium]|nr:benzoyl-CoA 2,3-epoxidase subunit BoxB [Alphaproteobacteria bacterium]
MAQIDLTDSIPNNVGLADQAGLSRTMAQFQADYMDWWRECGPQGFDAADVYLRMPTGVDSRGWATYAYSQLADFRWGLYQAELDEERRAVFGRLAGEPVLREVPGEFRDAMLKLLVTQADTEPASVEQITYLGRMAPSNYDLRNLFQINCEEGRHLWAIVHLLVAHFGKAGTQEVEGLLTRRSGSADNPRILNAFNSPIEEFLSFLFWSTLADRDGKFQLLSMSESAFDPLARTTRFMLFEEAHHMFVGDDGLRRVIQRTAELMQAHDTDDVAPHGGINLATLQRYMNYWAPQTIDLFGNELSSWSEDLFDAGLKGRPYEAEHHDEHVRLDDTLPVDVVADGALVRRDVPQRKAINEASRAIYLREIGTVVHRWNRMLGKMGIDFRFYVPDKRFNRRIGVYKDFHFSPMGEPVGAAAFQEGLADWLPSEAEQDHVKSLMQPVYEPGKIAGWIAPPTRGIDGKPVAYEYVRL